MPAQYSIPDYNTETKTMNSKAYCRSIIIAGYEGGIELIDSALTSDNPRARALALTAAHRLSILTINSLIDAISDPDANVRRTAFELCPRLVNPSNRMELTDAVLDCLNNDDDAEIAAFSLGELGSDSLEGLTQINIDRLATALSTQATENSEALNREAAVAALGSLGLGVDAVLSATKDIATVRRRAIVALAAFEGDDVVAALVAATEDRDWQVRTAAEDLLDDDY